MMSHRYVFTMLFSFVSDKNFFSFHLSSAHSNEPNCLGPANLMKVVAFITYSRSWCFQNHYLYDENKAGNVLNCIIFQGSQTRLYTLNQNLNSNWAAPKNNEKSVKEVSEQGILFSFEWTKLLLLL
jgi:hypothetical protein